MAYNVLKLPIWAYDEHVRRWIPKDSVISRSRKPYVQTSLRVVTYNIWFSRVHQPLRLQRLNALLLKSGAHVICMQEMTKEVLHELASQPWVQRRYLLSDMDGRTFHPAANTYGVVMFIDRSLSVTQLLTVPFNTRQGRKLLLAEIRLRDEIFHVGTVHLESIRRNADYRAEQLQVCQSIFNTLSARRSRVSQLLVGDFNYDSEWPENATNANTLAGWGDLWPRLHGPHDPGLTMGGDVRFDRMMFRSHRVKPTAIQLIGYRPIAQVQRGGSGALELLNFLSFLSEDDSSEYVFISDHFGLMADFSLRRV